MKNLFISVSIVFAFMLSGCGDSGSSGSSTSSQIALSEEEGSVDGSKASSFDSQFNAAKAAPITLESANAVSDFMVKSTIGYGDANTYSYIELPLSIIMQKSSAEKTALLSPPRSNYSDFICDSGSIKVIPTEGENPYPDRIDVSYNNCVKNEITMDGDMSIELDGDGQTITSELVTYTSDFTISRIEHTVKIEQGSNICVIPTDTGYHTKTVAKIEIEGKVYGAKNLVTEVDNTSVPGQTSFLFKSGLVYINNLANWLWISPDKEQLPFVINSEGELLGGMSNLCNRKGAYIKIEVYSVDLLKVSIDINNDGNYEKSKFIVIGNTIDHQEQKI